MRRPLCGVGRALLKENRRGSPGGGSRLWAGRFLACWSKPREEQREQRTTRDQSDLDWQPQKRSPPFPSSFRSKGHSSCTAISLSHPLVSLSGDVPRARVAEVTIPSSLLVCTVSFRPMGIVPGHRDFGDVFHVNSVFSGRLLWSQDQGWVRASYSCGVISKLWGVYLLQS